jgi:ADP-heptose:LPS heptosyltransferase
LNGEEDPEARELLTAAGVKEGERVIAFNTNASTMALARRWPDASFVSLIDRVMEAGLGRVALLGAPEEAPHVGRVQAMTRRPGDVVNLAGKSTLRGLVGILRRSALLVTNDSGPLHLAGALGTKTVSFFGPETPVLFGPRGPGHVTLYRGIDCSPCISIYNAKTVRCMRTAPECLSLISVDEAMAAVRRALGAAG